MKNKFYITTAIDYVNAKPHVGHAVEKIQADVLARWHRDVLKDDTYFLTGSDENALKNVQSAKKAGKPVEDFIAENSGYFQALKPMLNLSYDQFIRTTEKKHFDGAQKFWKNFKAEDIVKKPYKGMYCVGCEEFKMEKDLVDGKCPEHLTVPEIVEEENYFFKLSNYQKQLEELIENNTIKIIPDYRKNEVLSFIRQGLEDFSISRSVKRAEGWGVPVPGDESQIMYVWVDALSNYITALDYATDGDLYKKYWLENENRVHVIGKGILRFHAIYWPAMLLSAGIPLPTQILSHEYLTINNQKISKTLGNIIDPQEVVDKFGIDGARYLLLTSLPASKDGDISWEKMTEKYNADLANGLSNLIYRTLNIVEKNGGLIVPDLSQEEIIKCGEGFRISDGNKFYSGFSSDIDSYKQIFNDIFENTQHQNYLKINRALELICSGNVEKDSGGFFVKKLNQLIEDTKLWELRKTDDRLYGIVSYSLLESFRLIALLLLPFIPATSENIYEQLGMDLKKSLSNENIEKLFAWGGLTPGKKLGQKEILFRSIK